MSSFRAKELRQGCAPLGLPVPALKGQLAADGMLVWNPGALSVLGTEINSQCDFFGYPDRALSPNKIASVPNICMEDLFTFS